MKRLTIGRIFTRTTKTKLRFYSLAPVDLIAGQIPRRQRRLVEAWAELHETELLGAWQSLQNGELPQPIEPLK